MSQIDKTQLIAAIAARLKVRLDERDPAFILVELNRLVLEEAVACALKEAAPLADRITAAGNNMALNIARDAARSIDAEVEAARETIASEAQAARNEAAIAISKVAKSHEEAHAAIWIFLGMLLGCLFVAAGIVIGCVFAIPLGNLLGIRF